MHLFYFIFPDSRIVVEGNNMGNVMGNFETLLMGNLNDLSCPMEAMNGGFPLFLFVILNLEL